MVVCKPCGMSERLAQWEQHGVCDGAVAFGKVLSVSVRVEPFLAWASLQSQTEAAGGENLRNTADDGGMNFDDRWPGDVDVMALEMTGRRNDSGERKVIFEAMNPEDADQKS